MSIRYRPEIDGLRTIAVLSVIIYHAEFVLAGYSLLVGGFFGVDVFFVISGYLITSLIISELYGSGWFSVLNFYERRARRLLPALLLVILFSMVAAWFILLPAQFVDFSKSLVASIFFVSNFYWDLSLQEYGAESALLKPFLHTWSLAVEEQYYLVFPLMLLAIHKWCREKLPILILAGLLISLVFAVWFTSINAPSSFYMLSSRFWELLAGGFLASIQYRYPPKGNDALLNRSMPGLGILLLVYSFFCISYDSDHPGLVTVIPVLGTALVIRFSSERDGVTKLLASRVFVAIGLISYSLYLWHYPIFAFARNMQVEISAYEKLALIVLTFALSALGYFLVEKPFRNRKTVSAKRLVGVLLSTSLLVVVFCGYTIHQEGVRGRFSELELLYGLNEFDNTLLKEESWSILNELASEKGFEESEAERPSMFESDVLWFSPDEKKKKILIVGNSPSKDMFNAFYQNADQFPGHEFARFGIHPGMKEEQINALMKAPNFLHADAVIVRFMIRENGLEKFVPFVERLQQSGKRLYLASNSPVFSGKGHTPLFDWYMQEHGKAEVQEQVLGELYFQRRVLNYGGEVDTALRQLARRLDIPFLNLWDSVCDLQAQTCDGVTPQGYKSYYDNIHWTLEGARHFGTRIAELGWISEP